MVFLYNRALFHNWNISPQPPHRSHSTNALPFWGDSKPFCRLSAERAHFTHLQSMAGAERRRQLAVMARRRYNCSQQEEEYCILLKPCRERQAGRNIITQAGIQP